MKKVVYTTKEALDDIHCTTRDRQRAAEAAYKSYDSEWGRRRACRDIYEAYDNPSLAKVRAFQYCLQLCREHDGYDFRIIGHNCMTFSFGFKYTGKNTGRDCFAFITRDYDSYCFID